MEISVLQSLIDRTSNEIAWYEGSILFEKQYRHLYTEKWEIEQSYFKERWCKIRLPKLREIQKALKKEIAEEIDFQRWMERDE